MDTGMDTGPVGNDPSPPDGFLMCLCASRRNPNTLRLITNADTARTNIVAGGKLTPPRAQTKLETMSAFSLNILTETKPDTLVNKTVDRSTSPRQAVFLRL